MQTRRAKRVALARERQQGLGDGCVTDTSRAVQELLQQAKLRAGVIAVAAHCFNETRLPRRCPWSVAAIGHYGELSIKQD